MKRISFISGTHQVFKEYLVDNDGNLIKPSIVQNVEFMIAKYGESEIQCYKYLNDSGGYIILYDDFVKITLTKEDTEKLDGLYIARLRITDMSGRVFETEVNEILIKKMLYR